MYIMLLEVVAMKRRISSLEEARRTFATQEACEDYLAKIRWPDGIQCPKCKAEVPYRLEDRRIWECRKCGYQFSVTSGTIFHSTKLPLPKWFVTIWLMCYSPKGISAKQLERELGVHYETAWYLAYRVRRAMQHDIFEDRLGGIVEVDDAVVKADGGKATGNVPDNTKNVIGMASRSGPLRFFVVDTLQKQDIRRVIAENLGVVKKIYTDATSHYRFLGEIAPHRYVGHYFSWTKGQVHVNFVENAWSLFKRGLIGMYHHVSAKYLQDYLDEFAFRYSHRRQKHLLFNTVLANCEA